MLSAKDLNSMQKISPFRSERLFCEFLPQGYLMTTLNTVENKKEVIRLKVILGSLITLYDDFADRPDRFNPELLKLLYKVPFEKIRVNKAFLSDLEISSLMLAKTLFKKLYEGIQKLPNYHELKSIFEYDLKMFFMANQYSELLTQYPYIVNPQENKMYLQHNMGIVIAGMIDLMGVPYLNRYELGQARNLFLLGQRAGRISNVITTYERELKEGDFTNELFAQGNMNDLENKIKELEDEFSNIIDEMGTIPEISSFDISKYSQGIQNLHSLHLSLKGVI